MTSRDHSAWQNGQWLPREQIGLAFDDLGFVQSAIIVERLRTCRGIPLDLELHLERMRGGCQLLEIQGVSSSLLQSVVTECARRHTDLTPDDDFSIVIAVTPGRMSRQTDGPTQIVHPVRIDFDRLVDWYTTGQALQIADVRNVPPNCWSPTIKTRARLQYYLADLGAAKNSQPHTGAVLLDIDGNVTETSAANVIAVEGQHLVSPPLDEILTGISLRRTLRLGQQSGWCVQFEKLSPERAAAADELLLCGSTGCLWPASSFGDRVFEGCATRPAYQLLSTAWSRDIGLDFVAQAKRLSVVNQAEHHA